MTRALVRKANMSADLTGANTTYGLNTVAEYKAITTTLNIYAGIRKTPFGIIYTLDRTITSASNFSNFDDSSEAGTYASAGWRYLYIKMSDPTKIAISTNSPYDKNGGVSNIVTISSVSWVYLGAAYWTGTSWRECFSVCEKIYLTGTNFGNTGVHAYQINSITSNNNISNSTNGLFGTHLPGANTNTKSRIAKEVMFASSHCGNTRNDSSQSGTFVFTLTAFGYSITRQGSKHLLTPINGSSFFITDCQNLFLPVHTLHNTDNMSVQSTWDSVIIGANDGNTNVRYGIQWYVDQYIFV